MKRFWPLVGVYFAILFLTAFLYPILTPLLVTIGGVVAVGAVIVLAFRNR